MTPYEFLQASERIRAMYLQSLGLMEREDFEYEVKWALATVLAESCPENGQPQNKSQID